MNFPKKSESSTNTEFKYTFSPVGKNRGGIYANRDKRTITFWNQNLNVIKNPKSKKEMLVYSKPKATAILSYKEGKLPAAYFFHYKKKSRKPSGIYNYTYDVDCKLRAAMCSYSTSEYFDGLEKAVKFILGYQTKVNYVFNTLRPNFPSEISPDFVESYHAPIVNSKDPLNYIRDLLRMYDLKASKISRNILHYCSHLHRIRPRNRKFLVHSDLSFLTLFHYSDNFPRIINAYLNRNYEKLNSVYDLLDNNQKLNFLYKLLGQIYNNEVISSENKI